MSAEKLLTNQTERELDSKKYFMSYGLDLNKIEELSLTAKLPILRNLAKSSFLSKKAIANLIVKNDFKIRLELSSNQQINLPENSLETIWDQALLAQEENVLLQLLQRKNLSGKFLRRSVNSLLDKQQTTASSNLAFIHFVLTALITHQSLSPDIINRILEKKNQDDILEILATWQYLTEKQSLTIINNYQASISFLFDIFLRKPHPSKIYRVLYEKNLQSNTPSPARSTISALIFNHFLSLEDMLHLYDLEKEIDPNRPAASQNVEVQNDLKKAILESAEFQQAITKIGASFVKLTADDHFELSRKVYEHNKKKPPQNSLAICP